MGNKNRKQTNVKINMRQKLEGKQNVQIITMRRKIYKTNKIRKHEKKQNENLKHEN